MQARQLAAFLVVCGIILVLLCTFAFRLGLSQLDTFGWKKLLGTVVGVGMAAAGVLLLRGVARETGDEAEGAPLEEEDVRAA